MTKISVKTGDEASAETDAVADVHIWDGLGTCCRTLGLENAGNDRQKGLTDVYSGSLLSIKRLDYFASHGCKISDHALDQVVYSDVNESTS